MCSLRFVFVLLVLLLVYHYGHGKSNSKSSSQSSRPTCEICEVCGAGELSCIHKTTKERECVSTCDTEIDCELQEDKTPLPTCPSKCPSEEWVRSKTACYKFVSEGTNRSDAKAACESSGAHLVNIETEMEMIFLSCKLTEQHGLEVLVNYWTGAIRQGDVWEWEGTGVVIPIKANTWGFDQPTFVGNCVLLNGAKSFLLDDTPCNIPFRYICEIEAL